MIMMQTSVLWKLIFIRGIPVKVVGHEEDVRSSRDQSMTRFHHLKAQKAERPHQFYTILPVLVEADKHTDHLQMLFSKLQQRDEALLAAVWKGFAGNLHKQAISSQHCLPLDKPRRCGTTLEMQDLRTTGTSRLFCHSQLPVGVQRLCCGWVIPCSVPSPTWDLQRWVRGIRSTTEALDQWYYYNIQSDSPSCR